MTREEMFEQLDAYGHLTWTIGDLDWLACFDAQRFGDEIAYHVIVNCESGGFIDTIEKGVVPVAEANRLLNLPDSYLDAGLEGHYQTLEKNKSLPRNQRIPLGHFAYRDGSARWRRHIRRLMTS